MEENAWLTYISMRYKRFDGCDIKISKKSFLMFMFDNAAPAVHTKFSISSLSSVYLYPSLCVLSVHVRWLMQLVNQVGGSNLTFCHPQVTESSLATRPHFSGSAHGSWRKISSQSGSSTYCLCPVALKLTRASLSVVRMVDSLTWLNEYVWMLIPNVCTHNHGYNKMRFIWTYLCALTPTPAVCSHTCCGWRKLYLVSAETGNQRNAHTPSLNENFHFNRCGIPRVPHLPFHFCVLSTATWYSFLAQARYTETVSWAHHNSLH